MFISLDNSDIGEAMISIARLLTIFAMIAMISAPAMACCLTGHDDAAHLEIGVNHDSAAMSDTDTCHDTMAAMQVDQTPAAPSAPDCAGCFDCETTLASTDDALQPAPFSAAQSADLVTTLTTRFSGFDAPRLVLTTGPPALDHIANLTLVELKQFLLI
ncbi:hypothetical protein [Hirschia baltica]|nr:hypothetical protein [Hirschia baltica]